MLYTIAIPAYNRINILKESIEKILHQLEENPGGELLIVDDASTDGTAVFLDNYRHSIRILRNEENKGIAVTRNILVNEALGKFIIFMDSDIIPSGSFVKEHLKVLEKKENIISQGKLILISDLNDIHKNKFYFLTDFSTAFFATANVGIKKETIIKAGMFDESFTGYGWEDLELGIRLKKMGIKILRNNRAMAYHCETDISLNELDRLKSKEAARARGAVYFLKKHKMLEVKMMTQVTTVHFLLDSFLNFIIEFENRKFLILLEKLEKKRNKLFIPLYRLYLNHFNIKILKELIKELK